MSNGVGSVSLRSLILGPGEEEGQTIRVRMHIRCKNCASVILGKTGKRSGGLRNEQVSARGGADDHNKREN